MVFILALAHDAVEIRRKELMTHASFQCSPCNFLVLCFLEASSHSKWLPREQVSLFAHLDFAEMVLVRQVRLLARRNSALRHFGIIPVCCALDHKVHIGLRKFGWQLGKGFWSRSGFSFSISLYWRQPDPFVLRDYSIGSKTSGCRKIPLRCFLPLVP